MSEHRTGPLPTAHAAVGSSSRIGGRLGELGGRALRARELGLVLVLLITALVLSVLSDSFANTSNLLNIGRNASELGIIALGMTIVLITRHIDLSVGAIYGLGGITAGKLLEAGQPVTIAVAGALGLGVMVGLLNGVLVGYLKLNSFMVTLAMLNVVLGTMSLWTSGTTVSLPATPEAQKLLIFGDAIGETGLNTQFVLLLGAVILLGLFLRFSTLGFNMYAAGGNPDAARIAGVQVPAVVTAAFCFSGFLAAFAGVMAMGFVGSTNPSAGIGLEFDVFAAAIIGGASLAGGRGTMIGTLLGAIFLSLVRNGFILLGVSPFAITLAIGLIILLAIGLDRWVTARQERS